jgi:hypothetical protein
MNSKIYLYPKEDNTILGPNIKINFKSYILWAAMSEYMFQNFMAEQYKRLQIDNNKLLTIEMYHNTS